LLQRRETFVTAAASVVTISITAEALAALADGRAADRRPDGKGKGGGNNSGLVVFEH